MNTVTQKIILGAISATTLLATPVSARSLQDLSVNCTINSENTISSDRESFIDRSCIEQTVDTIYNPLTSWQPKL